MKKWNLFSVCVLFVTVLATSTAFCQSSADYKAKIEAINKEMVKNMLAGNTEKLLSLYTPDAISLPSYQPIHDGIAAIKQASDAEVKSGVKYTSFEPVTLKVMVNGNQITEIGTYKITLTMPGMDKPVDDHGKYLTIWEKQKDGSLKVKVETWNSDVNPMDMMKSMDQNPTDKKN